MGKIQAATLRGRGIVVLQRTAEAKKAQRERERGTSPNVTQLICDQTRTQTCEPQSRLCKKKDPGVSMPEFKSPYRAIIAKQEAVT